MPTNEDKSLKSYINICSLWTTAFDIEIETKGSCLGVNNIVYHDKDSLYKDIQIQIEKLIECGELVNDISIEEAMLILRR